VEIREGTPTNLEIQDDLCDAEPASVLTVDDQAQFRALLRRVVDETPGLVVVGEADSGESAVVLARSLEPDLVLMDVRMPGIGGIAATRQIKMLRPATLVVLVSTMHSDQLVETADGSRADVTVCKSDLRPSVLEGIWRTHGRPQPLE
jgi:two-component system, NarL family, invasion response regulator UvrY